MSDKSAKKRKKPSWYYKKSAKQGRFNSASKCLDKDMRGFLITCSNNQERAAVSDAYSLLNRHADILYGEEKIIKTTKDDMQSESEEEDIDKALKEEISAIKETKSTERRFVKKESGAKQVIFIKTLLEDPNELMDRILEDIFHSHNCPSRYLLRMLPVIGTCKTETIEKEVGSLLDPFFSAAKDCSYCLSPKIRNNDKVKRNDLINSFGSVIRDINNEATVDYENPDYMIGVNVIKSVVCVSVLKNFNKYRKYNLQELACSDKVRDTVSVESKSDDDRKTARKEDDPRCDDADEQNVAIAQEDFQKSTGLTAPDSNNSHTAVDSINDTETS